MSVNSLSKSVSAWLKNAGLLESDQNGGGRIRAAQIAAMSRFTPFMMIGNSIFTVVVISSVFSFADFWLLGIWAATAISVVALVAYKHFSRRSRSSRQTASVRSIRRATFNAFIIATLWAVVPVVWLSGTSNESRLVLATLLTAIIGAGGFAMATVPSAAVVFVVVVSAGSFIGALDSFHGYAIPIAVLLIVYCTIVLNSVDGTSKLFIQRFHAEAKLVERGEIIELLLNEFEENSSDWLFQTDASGIIVEHSARFAVVAEKERSSLVGLNLTDLLFADDVDVIRTKLAGKTPFKDLDVRSAGAKSSWWSLTAKPEFAKTGEHIGWRGVGSDITSKKTAEQQLEYLAYFDPLTGLANRAKFRESAEKCLADAKKRDETYFLLAVDLDQFKMVNDTLGHEAGDELLQITAKIITSTIGSGNLVARLGNDEFGVILYDCRTVLNAEDIARRIIQAFEPPIRLQTGSVGVCVSIGFIQIPDHGPTPDHLMRNVDLALLKAKEIGGSGFAFFDHSMNDVFQQRAMLSNDLRQAANLDGQLEVWYQPQIDIDLGTIAGFEALMRWNHPIRGYISPSEFIPVAESSGLISSLGHWILKEAILQSKRWHSETGLNAYIAVNISAVQLWQPDIVESISKLLRDADLPPSLLCLEMTESLFVDFESGRVQKVVTDLKSLGVTLALDDFGTGYSSLSYLNQLPFDKLKIDRSFVRNSVTGDKERNLLEVIVKLGHGLGMTVIAEGVETSEELAILRGIGCNHVQGYYFGKPAPANKAFKLASEIVLQWTPDTHSKTKSKVKSA